MQVTLDYVPEERRWRSEYEGEILVESRSLTKTLHLTTQILLDRVLDDLTPAGGQHQVEVYWVPTRQALEKLQRREWVASLPDLTSGRPPRLERLTRQQFEWGQLDEQEAYDYVGAFFHPN